MVHTLRELGAPDALVEWVDEAGYQDAWDGCDKPDWLVWMGAAAGLPVAVLLDGVASALDHVLADLPPRTRAPLLELMRLADDDDNPVELETLLARIEAAEDGHIETYRRPPVAGAASATRATTRYARAREALAVATARATAAEELTALDRGAAIGVPATLMTRRMWPLGISNASTDAVRHPIVDAIALATDALEEASRSFAGDDLDDLEGAEGELSDHIHEVLDPARRELLSGWAN
jgi:hypothetical protein